jgi:hypothetical protein
MPGDDNTTIIAVTVVIHVDLSREPDRSDDNRDRHKLAALDSIPPGARVVVYVGGRQWVPLDTASWLHAVAQRLQVELHGTPEANMHRWVAAARTGRDEVVA